MIQRSDEIEPRHPERGKNPKKNSGGDGDYQRGGKNVAIHAGAVHGRDARWNQAREELVCKCREDQTCDASKPREQQAFGQKLPRNSCAARAERQAHGNFAPPTRSAREQQVGNVGAGNEEHEADSSDQDEKRGTRLPRKLFPQRHRKRADFCVRRRILLLQLLGDGSQVGIRDFERHTGFQSSDDLQMVIPVVRELRRRELHRGPQLRIAVGKLKTTRHHADHVVFLVVQPDLLADDLWIAAKPAPEKSLAQDNYAGRAGNIVRGDEVAAQSGACAKNREKICGYEISGNLFGISFTGEVERAAER